MKKLRLYAAMFRVEQWGKNLLVFLPLVLFPNISTSDAGLVILVFMAFCFCSSTIYIVNDWTDRSADAMHPTKKFRPFASQELQAQDAALGFVLASFSAGFLLWYLSSEVMAVTLLLGFYVLQSLVYSYWLKNVTLLEMMIVSTGYSYRALAGGLAVGLPTSTWILATIFLASVFMVALKRMADITACENPEALRRSFRTYTPQFLSGVANVSASAAVVSYLLFTLSGYAQTKFDNPYLPLSAIFIVYAVFRYTQVALVTGLGGNPIKLITRDKHLRVCVALCVAFLFVSNALLEGL